MKSKVRVAVLLGTALLGAGVTMEAAAKSVCVSIAGKVTALDDPGALLAGAVRVGDALTGSYTYETTTTDSNSLPTVGDYRHTAYPAGMEVKINGLSFRTDPANVDFLFEMINDHGNPIRDSFVLRSYKNLFDVSAPADAGGRPTENTLSWQGNGSGTGLLSSTALPDGPFLLSNFPTNALTIDSRQNYSSGGFGIRGQVTSTQLCSVPITIDRAWISPVRVEQGEVIDIVAEISGNQTTISQVLFILNDRELTTLTDPDGDGRWTGQYRAIESLGFKSNVRIVAKNAAGTNLARWPGFKVE